MKKPFALKGNILYSESASTIKEMQDSYLICDNGQVAGVFPKLPEKYANIDVFDKGDSLIVPGFVDLHLHAPQYAFRGLGMNLELLDWLKTYTFPQECKYEDMDYAKKAYRMFVDDLVKGGTTRASIFATVHSEATLALMDLLEESGLKTLVGRVNMNQDSHPKLQEKDADIAFADTVNWLKDCEGRYKNTATILTPRSMVNCNAELVTKLSGLQKQTKLPVQSHLSENRSEIAIVAELYPQSKNYADAYLQCGLFGGEDCPTIMAHCVYSIGDELQLLKERGIWVAHCPISNSGLSSGIAPIRAFLNNGIKVGLGSDIAGGYNLSMLGVMADAMKDSKLRWCLVDESLSPLTIPEVFYLATRGGGSFFGKVGAFEEGFEFDAIVMDDSMLSCPFELSLIDRLERLIYLGNDNNITEKYIAGHQCYHS